MVSFMRPVITRSRNDFHVQNRRSVKQANSLFHMELILFNALPRDIKMRMRCLKRKLFQRVSLAIQQGNAFCDPLANRKVTKFKN